MNNHFKSSRFTTVMILSFMSFAIMSQAIATNEKVAIALATPLFLALTALWGGLMGTKAIEHFKGKKDAGT